MLMIANDCCPIVIKIPGTRNSLNNNLFISRQSLDEHISVMYFSELKFENRRLERTVLPRRHFRNNFSNKEYPRSETKNFLNEFLESSTIHGLNQFSVKNKHWSEYLLWVLVMLGAIIGMCYMGLNAWNRYQYYPTVISIEKDYRNWNMSYAMATFCPSVNIDENILELIAERYKVKDREGFVKFFKILSRMRYGEFNELPLYEEIDCRHYLTILEEARFNFTFEISDTKNFLEDSVLMVTENGLCYGVNTAAGIYFTIGNFTRSLPVGRNQNLNLLFGNPLDGEIMVQIMNLRGEYNMTITGPFDIPDISVRRISSKRNQYLILELTVLPIVSSERLRNLSPEQRKCRFSDESNLEVSEIYGYNLCRMQCRANLAYELCHCIPFFYKQSNTKAYCDASGLRCLSRYGYHIANLRHPSTDKKIQCGCLPLCIDLHYLVAEESIRPWTGFTHMQYSMSEFPKTRLKREVIFGFNDFLVSIGGSAGLFLGCSLLSFIEIIYFIILQLFLTLRKSHQCSRIRSIFQNISWNVATK